MIKTALTSFICVVISSVALAQAPASSDSLVVQQVARITVLAGEGAVLDIVHEDGETFRLTLVGPDVTIQTKPGHVFWVNDLQSPNVAAALEDDAAVYLGNLQLVSTPYDEEPPEENPGLQVTVDSALVEIFTDWVPADTSATLLVLQNEKPLNQRADYIRAVRQEVIKRRSQ